jgi:4'-phosphopantetheinyl transferase EntD
VPVADHTSALFDEERALAARFVPRRLRTFSTGRLAARRALGVSASIGRRPDGAPAAPAGWRLSITHTDEIAVAVACPAVDTGGIGVDLEDIGRMDVKLRRLVVGPLDRVAEDVDAERLTATFSLRESLFKALPGADPHAIFIRWDRGRVEAGMAGANLRYGWTRAGARVLSYALFVP